MATIGQISANMVLRTKGFEGQVRKVEGLIGGLEKRIAKFERAAAGVFSGMKGPEFSGGSGSGGGSDVLLAGLAGASLAGAGAAVAPAAPIIAPVAIPAPPVAPVEAFRMAVAQAEIQVTDLAKASIGGGNLIKRSLNAVNEAMSRLRTGGGSVLESIRSAVDRVGAKTQLWADRMHLVGMLAGKTTPLGAGLLKIGDALESVSVELTGQSILWPKLVNWISGAVKNGGGLRGMFQRLGATLDKAAVAFGYVADAARFLWTIFKAGVDLIRRFATDLDFVQMIGQKIAGVFTAVVIPILDKLGISLTGLFPRLANGRSRMKLFTGGAHAFARALRNAGIGAGKAGKDTGAFGAVLGRLFPGLDGLLGKVELLQGALKFFGLSFGDLADGAGGLQGVLGRMIRGLGTLEGRVFGATRTFRALSITLALATHPLSAMRYVFQRLANPLRGVGNRIGSWANVVKGYFQGVRWASDLVYKGLREKAPVVGAAVKQGAVSIGSSMKKIATDSVQAAKSADGFGNAMRAGMQPAVAQIERVAVGFGKVRPAARMLASDASEAFRRTAASAREAIRPPETVASRFRALRRAIADVGRVGMGSGSISAIVPPLRVAARAAVDFGKSLGSIRAVRSVGNAFRLAGVTILQGAKNLNLWDRSVAAAQRVTVSLIGAVATLPGAIAHLAGPVTGVGKGLLKLAGHFLGINQAGGFAAKKLREIPIHLLKGALAAGQFVKKWLTLPGLVRAGGMAIGWTTKKVFGLAKSLIFGSAETRKMRAEQKALARDMQKAAAAAQSGAAGMKSFRIATASGLGPLAGYVRMLGPLALFGALAGTIGASEKFDRAIKRSASTMALSTEQMGRMKVAAKDVARTSVFSAEEAAIAYRELGKAGLSAEEAIATLPIAAKFAQASFMDLNEGTEILTRTARALGMNGPAGLQRLGDMLAEGARQGVAQEDLAAGLSKVGATASALGVPLEEAAAGVSAYVMAGKEGEEAGVDFARTLRMLDQGARANEAAFRDLGVEVFSAGKMRPVADIVFDLSQGLQGLSTSERSAKIEALGFKKQTREGLDVLLAMNDAVDSNTIAFQKSAGAMDEITSGQLTEFEKGWRELKAAMLDTGQGGFQPLVDAIGTGLQRAADMVRGLRAAWDFYWQAIALSVESSLDQAGAFVVAFGAGARATMEGIADAWRAMWGDAWAALVPGFMAFGAGFTALVDHFRDVGERLINIAIGIGEGIVASLKAAFSLENPFAAAQSAFEERIKEIGSGLPDVGNRVGGAMKEAMAKGILQFGAGGEFKAASARAGTAFSDAFGKAFAREIDPSINARLRNALDKAARAFADGSGDAMKAAVADALALADQVFNPKPDPDPEEKISGGAIPGGTAALIEGTAEAFSAVQEAKRQGAKDRIGLDQLEQQRRMVKEQVSMNRKLDRQGPIVRFAEW